MSDLTVITVAEAVFEYGVACDIKSFMTGFALGNRFIISGINHNIPTLAIEDPADQLRQILKKLRKYQHASM